MLESTVIGAMGSAIGLVLGIALTYAIAPLLLRTGALLLRTGAVRAIGFAGRLGRSATTITLQPVITLENIALALVLGIAVGVLAGIYPAYRAAKMKSVEALRYV